VLLLLSLTMPTTGPKEQLDSTEVAQPALFVGGLAAAERLKAEVSENMFSQLACPHSCTRVLLIVLLPMRSFVHHKQNPAAFSAVDAVAGLSLGEYCALVTAGALSFEDGLKVVRW
jgi:[acyl-carrier-protein] S-malonyltransferase